MCDDDGDCNLIYESSLVTELWFLLRMLLCDIVNVGCLFG